MVIFFGKNSEVCFKNWSNYVSTIWDKIFIIIYRHNNSITMVFNYVFWNDRNLWNCLDDNLFIVS
jgi:hypothetical protein